MHQSFMTMLSINHCLRYITLTRYFTVHNTVTYDTAVVLDIGISCITTNVASLSEAAFGLRRRHI